MLAAQAPWWEPGATSGYHALTHGRLIGEVLRRVTGKTLKQFVADEVAGPAARCGLPTFTGPAPDPATANTAVS